jgi:hypothetical protein
MVAFKEESRLIEGCADPWACGSIVGQDMAKIRMAINIPSPDSGRD